MRSRREGRRWVSLRRGFRQRNPLVLAAAAGLAVLSLIGLQEALLHGAYTNVAQGRFLRINNDDFVHISYRVAKLRRHPPTGRTVYLFGGSGAMESIVGERSLARAIRWAGGGDVGVVSLAAHQQSLAQTLAIVDNLPSGRSLLLVGLTPMRFATSSETDASLLSGRPILVRSPRLEQLSQELYGRRPPISGVLAGILDYTGGYLRARAYAGPLWGIRIPYARHYYPPGTKGALPLAKRQNIRKVQARDKKRYDQYGDYNFRLLEEIVRLARERGFAVAFYDQPLNVSAGGPVWEGVVPAYRARASELGHRHGVPYLRVDKGISLRDDDFADLYHLLDSGRAKWQAELARQIAAIMREPAREPRPLP